jgi:hypothetical protein
VFKASFLVVAFDDDDDDYIITSLGEVFPIPNLCVCVGKNHHFSR